MLSIASADKVVGGIRLWWMHTAHSCNQYNIEQ